MTNMLEPIKNTKNLISLLTNLIYSGPLKRTSRSAGWTALLKITTFEHETPEGHPKYQKTQIVA